MAETLESARKVGQAVIFGLKALENEPCNFVPPRCPDRGLRTCSG